MCIDTDERQESTMLEWDSEFIKRSLVCFLLFPKDRIVGSDFSDISFFGEFSFT